MCRETNRSVREEMYFGGKGLNVSFVLKQLGTDSRALGFTGLAIEQSVTEAGVNADFVRLEQGFSRINVKVKSGEETELNGQGPDIPPAALEELFRKLDSIQDGDKLVLAGSVPASLPSDIYEQILARLSCRNIRTVVDASKDLLKNVLKYRPFLVKPNNHELGELFGVKLTTLEEISEYAAKLRQMGSRNVLVSMAGNGALLLDKNGTQHSCGVCRGGGAQLSRRGGFHGRGLPRGAGQGV